MGLGLSDTPPVNLAVVLGLSDPSPCSGIRKASSIYAVLFREPRFFVEWLDGTNIFGEWLLDVRRIHVIAPLSILLLMLTAS